MSALGMFGKVAQGYLDAAEKNQAEKLKAEKEQRKLATEIYMKIADDPSARPETRAWAWKGLTEISEGKFKGIDIKKIQPAQADPGQPPELGQMPAPAGQPQPERRQMPTPPPPTGAQYLTPPSPEEQLQQQVGAIESVAGRAGIAPERIQQGIERKLLGPPPSEGPQGVLTRQQVVDPDNPDKPKLLLINNRSGEVFDAETLEPWTGPMTPWVKPGKETLAEQYVSELMKQGMSLVEAVDKYNIRFSTSSGFRLVEQPDGTLAMVPITTTRVTGRGKPKLPTPPGEPTTPRIVGGKTTAASRARAEFAGSLLVHIDPINKQIDELEKSGRLGPIMGRWNAFMTGPIGIGDPDYKELKDNISLLHSGLSLVHVGARGGIKLLERFDKMVAAERMTPELLRASMRAVESWLTSYEQIPERQLEKLRRKQGFPTPPSAAAASPIEVDDIVMYEGKPHRVLSITNGKAELEPLD